MERNVEQTVTTKLSKAKRHPKAYTSKKHVPPVEEDIVEEERAVSSAAEEEAIEDDEGEDELDDDDDDEGASKECVVGSIRVYSLLTVTACSAESVLSRTTEVDIKGGWKPGHPCAFAPL